MKDRRPLVALALLLVVLGALLLASPVLTDCAQTVGLYDSGDHDSVPLIVTGGDNVACASPPATTCDRVASAAPARASSASAAFAPRRAPPLS